MDEEEFSAELEKYPFRQGAAGTAQRQTRQAPPPTKRPKTEQGSATASSASASDEADSIPSSKPIHIEVRLLQRGGERYSITIASDKPCSWLKRLVELHSSIHPRALTIVYNGRVLQDGKAVGTYFEDDRVSVDALVDELVNDTVPRRNSFQSMLETFCLVNFGDAKGKDTFEEYQKMVAVKSK